ncbi:MAG TPA: cyclase family protein [Candidatus Binataceae bacterium]|nr:cyclase family protein [Candidatus Binataceae bacterium]
MATRLTVDEVKGLYEKISNWGRWGKEDERGALNYITLQKRAAGAKLAQNGEIVSLSLPLSTKSGPDNPQPVQHMMLHAGAPGYASLDYFAIAPHGMSFTHLDALCHVFWQGKMYNGFSEREVGRFGARKCSIDVTRDGVMSRGVLLDIPKARKVDWLEPRDAIFPEDLEAAEKLGASNLHVDEGDVLLIRTGRHKRRAEKGVWDPRREGLPGLDASCLQWLHDRRIAVLGCDAVSDISPSPYGAEMGLPIHVGTLVIQGIHLIDNADLEALSSACERHRRYEFLFTMAPLILEHGTASPVNPLALF